MNTNMITSMIAMLFIATATTAQTSADGKINTDAIQTAGKVMKHIDKFGVAQLTVSYKLTSTESTMGKERSTGKSAGAKLTAYLETTDGQLTSEDFQEITDYFYSYFQKKLKEKGIDTVAWKTIAATDFYKDADEKTVSNDEQKGSDQVWVTFNANKGNILYGGFAAFAFGKIKKASNFCNEIGGAAGFFYVTVDFADILVNLKISTGGSVYPSGYYPYTVTTSYKYHSATKPDMKILPSDTNSLLWNAKSQAQNVSLQQDLKTDTKYETAVNQDPSRLKNKAFAFAKSMNPVVIETTREKYKSAAKTALEKYADTFIAKVQEEKKG